MSNKNGERLSPVDLSSPSRLAYAPTSLTRACGLGLGAGLLIVHLLWRLDASFDHLTLAGFVLSIALFAIEAFIALALAVTAIADILPASVAIEPEAVPELELPSVDIFVIVANPIQTPKAAYSLAAAAQLDYPRELVRLHLIGIDRATEKAAALATLAERMKASWLAASPEATAGTAMNAVLTRTSGSLALMLSAGEAPTADFLRRIVAGFHTDPRLAYIDVPVFAIDGDPVLSDLDVTQRMPNEPGHFFKSCLKTIGTASGNLGLGQRTIWRRAALSASGNCSRWNLRPDAPARIRAAESGWRRGIVARPMIAAIAPDSVKEYLRHRLAARIGTIDAALTRDTLLAAGLTLRERLSWAPALFAAVLPFAWALAFALPPLAILAQISLFGGTDTAATTSAVVISLLVALAMAGALNAGMRGGMIAVWSEMLESLLSAPSLFALYGRRINAGKAIPEPEHANGLLVVLFAISLAGTTAGITAFLMKPELFDAVTPLLALTVIEACLFACLLGAIAEPRQRRMSPRVSRRVKAQLLLGGEKYLGRLADISVHGARFLAEESIELQARALAGQLTITTAQGETTLPVQLSRQSEASGRSAFGLSFTGRTVGEFATVVRLAHRSGDAYADLCDARARPPGLARLFGFSSLRGIWAFLKKLNPPTPSEAKWVPIRRSKLR
ncbi:MAG: PilZ domain-containing protein [Alphaproteobacteria bacterium]|nr:PilZ domain-containing protein [Alphaproteobacteria bacterium]